MLVDRMTESFGKELFAPPFSNKIIKVLPTLFNMVELENMRGERLGMEVGTARERVIVALFMLAYSRDKVEFPPSTMHEIDVIVKGLPVSIKTKTNKKPSDYGGVKLVWTTDWDKVNEFVETFIPSAYMLFVNIVWGGEGGFFLITPESQKNALKELGDGFFKLPSKGTNPRGISLSATAMKMMQDCNSTQSLTINWQKDITLLKEEALYDRWINLWNAL